MNQSILLQEDIPDKCKSEEGFSKAVIVIYKSNI